MYRTMEEIEDLGLQPAAAVPYSCAGCVFEHENYGGVKCTEVPCTPYVTGEGCVIWVKRESPEQGRGILLAQRLAEALNKERNAT